MSATTHDRYQAHISCPIVKSDGEKRLVTGIVLQPGVEDAHGDVVSAEVIEDAAHAFVAKYNESNEMGVQHKLFGLPDVHLVESTIAHEDTVIGGQPVIKGTWYITVKVENDELWEGVKGGSLTGFSIGATATVPADPEVQVEADAGAEAKLTKDASSATEAVVKARPLLALDVNEVSLVDAAANERVFLVTKSKVQDPIQETPMKPTFLVTLSLAKDMGKIKMLSKELAVERLAQANAMIETLKSEFESFTDIGQLWKAVDDIHGMLWPVEQNIGTAVFKSLAEGEGAVALVVDADQLAAIEKMVGEIKADDAASLAAAIEKALTEVVPPSFDDLLTAQLDAIKAKSITPKRLAELGALAEGLAAAVAEMSPEITDTEDTDVGKSVGLSIDDISALLDAKLDPVSKRLDALEAGPEPTAEEQEAVAKAKVQEDLEKAKADAVAAQEAQAVLQKQLEELEAGTTGDEDEEPPEDADEEPVKKSLWSSVVNQPTRKQKAAAAVAAKRTPST